MDEGGFREALDAARARQQAEQAQQAEWEAAKAARRQLHDEAMQSVKDAAQHFVRHAEAEGIPRTSVELHMGHRTESYGFLRARKRSVPRYETQVAWVVRHYVRSEAYGHPGQSSIGVLQDGTVLYNSRQFAEQRDPESHISGIAEEIIEALADFLVAPPPRT
jgi:hypothetical protein